MPKKQSAGDKPWHKRRLRALGKSQVELAEILGLNPSAVSLIFQGRRNVRACEAVQIATFLEVGVDRLLGIIAADQELPSAHINGRAANGEIELLSEPCGTTSAPPDYDAERDLAIEIADNALAPRYRAGEILFLRPVELANLARWSGHEIAAERADGRVVLRILYDVKDGGASVDLADLTGELERGVAIRRAWSIAWHIPRQAS